MLSTVSYHSDTKVHLTNAIFCSVSTNMCNNVDEKGMGLLICILNFCVASVFLLML